MHPWPMPMSDTPLVGVGERGNPDSSSHLNSGEATTIFASWGSRGYSAMMVPTCKVDASEHDRVLSDVKVSFAFWCMGQRRLLRSAAKAAC